MSWMTREDRKRDSRGGWTAEMRKGTGLDDDVMFSILPAVRVRVRVQGLS